MEQNHWAIREHLFFRQATEIVGSNGEGLIILTDTDKFRQIVIPCGKDKIGWFKSWSKGDDNRKRHLPDILVEMLKMKRLQLEIDIDKIYKGSYQAMLTASETLDQLPIDIVDGIMLNRISGGTIPIMIDKSLYMRQSSLYNEKMNGVALPINTLSDSMLERALKDSIAKENYELAAQIQSEIKNRQQNTGK